MSRYLLSAHSSVTRIPTVVVSTTRLCSLGKAPTTKAHSAKEAIEDLMALRCFFERVRFLGDVTENSQESFLALSRSGAACFLGNYLLY